MTLSGTPVVDQCEAAINHDWGTGSPAPGVNADGFSASWDGSFTFTAGHVHVHCDRATTASVSTSTARR